MYHLSISNRASTCVLVPLKYAPRRQRCDWRPLHDRTPLLKDVEIYSVIFAIIDATSIVPPSLFPNITNWKPKLFPDLDFFLHLPTFLWLFVIEILQQRQSTDFSTHQLTGKRPNHRFDKLRYLHPKKMQLCRYDWTFEIFQTPFPTPTPVSVIFRWVWPFKSFNCHLN